MKRKLYKKVITLCLSSLALINSVQLVAAVGPDDPPGQSTSGPTGTPKASTGTTNTEGDSGGGSAQSPPSNQPTGSADSLPPTGQSQPQNSTDPNPQAQPQNNPAEDLTTIRMMLAAGNIGGALAYRLGGPWLACLVSMAGNLPST